MGEGKVLFSAIAKPGMFGLGMAPKDNFLGYSTQLVLLIIRLVPGNVIMVVSNMYRKSPITGDWIYRITWKHVLAFMFFVFLFICLFVKYLIIFVFLYLPSLICVNNRMLAFLLKLFLF